MAPRTDNSLCISYEALETLLHSKMNSFAMYNVFTNCFNEFFVYVHRSEYFRQSCMLLLVRCSTPISIHACAVHKELRSESFIIFRIRIRRSSQLIILCSRDFVPAAMLATNLAEIWNQQQQSGSKSMKQFKIKTRDAVKICILGWWKYTNSSTIKKMKN